MKNLFLMIPLLLINCFQDEIEIIGFKFDPNNNCRFEEQIHLGNYTDDNTPSEYSPGLTPCSINTEDNIILINYIEEIPSNIKKKYRPCYPQEQIILKDICDIKSMKN